jgi:predicted PurR-regulated permease PerM
MILGIVMGLLTYIGLSILGIKYAIILGVVAGVMEIVPFFGPLISGLLACIVALSVSPLLAFFAILLTVVLHQLENSFLAPKILQKAIGLPPAVIIIGLLIGGKLLGLAGALLAAPILGIIFVIIQERETLKLLLSKSDD